MGLPRRSIDSNAGATSDVTGPDFPRASSPLPDQSEQTPLLRHDHSDHVAAGHNHGHGSGHGHGGHDHSSMNMRALVLHVLGDALGNVGVIATGLIIWQTAWPYKYYCDPVISLVITIIIFSSALPLGERNFTFFGAILLLTDALPKL